MFGNLGEMANLLKKAKDIQKNAEKMKAQLAQSEFGAGDTLVHATVSGDFRVKTVHIAEEARGRADLDALVTATVNEAMQQARNAMQEQLKEVTGGINLPGLF